MSSIAASLDGTHVAVLREGELTLYGVEPFAVITRVTIPGPVAAPATPIFVTRQLLVHGVVGERTHLTLLQLPKLTLVSQLELEAPTRFLAATHAYALLDRGDDAFVATCTSTAAAVAPLRVPVQCRFAIGLEQPQFLTWSGRGAEIWDAASRRPEARVALELTHDTMAVGMTGQVRSVWIATSRPELIVSRLSDGRTISIPLDGTPERVTAHPVSSWMVADVGGVPYAINTALRSVARFDGPLGGARAIVPMPGVDTDAFVIIDEGDRVSRHALGVDGGAANRPRGLSLAIEPLGAAPLPEPTPAPPSTLIDPPRPKPASPKPGGAPASASAETAPAPSGPKAASPASPAPRARPPSVAERLAGRAPVRSAGAAPVAGPDAAAAPAPAQPDGDPTARPGEAAESKGASAPGPMGVRSLSSARSAGTEPRPARAHVALDWRDSLCTWSRTVLDGRPAEALPAGRTPLARLAERADLSLAAARILHLLYAEWLAGKGDTGVAALTLAEVGGGADAWSEALGTGRLAALGLVRSDVGRCTLVRAVGTFLDGRDASLERIGVQDQTDAGEGLFRVAAADGEDPRATAQRVATVLGQVAFIEDTAPLSVARLEAWLRELALITSLDVADLSPFDLRPRETLLAIVPADTPDDGDGAPFWRG